MMETLAGVAFAALWVLLWLWTPTDFVLWGKKPEYPEPYRPPEAPQPDLSFIGKVGDAHTPLRPVGSVLIDGEQHTARTQGEFIDAGQPVVVLRWAAGELIVEAIGDRR